MYEFWVTVGENGVATEPPIKGCNLCFDEIDLCGLLMVIAMNLNSQYCSS